MNGTEGDSAMNTKTQQYLKRVSSETKRRGVPWALLIAAGICIGAAVLCGVYAFTH